MIGANSSSITMDFTSKSVPTDSFDYAVASRGQVTISKGTISGVVRRSEGRGDAEKLSVQFARAGMKKLIRRYANLELL